MRILSIRILKFSMLTHVFGDSRGLGKVIEMTRRAYLLPWYMLCRVIRRRQRASLNFADYAPAAADHNFRST